MEKVNMHQAKTHFSKLVERVEKGEEILIARNGQPVAKLVSIKPQTRRPGMLKGRIRMSDDFDAPLPESLAAAFRGESS